MYKIYGIPNCDTVKKARTYLESRKLDYEFVDFKKTPPTKEQITLWEKAFGSLPVNEKGQTFKKNAEIYKTLKASEKIDFIIKNSSMIKRPILQKDNKVLSFGFDPMDYEKVLGK